MSETPRTDGRIYKCLDLSSENACDEYLDLCLTLERELAAMTRERDELRRKLDAQTSRLSIDETMPEKIGNILASVGIIDGAAIDDPEGYDDGRTLRHLADVVPELKEVMSHELRRMI